jgi:hypothetical protein
MDLNLPRDFFPFCFVFGSVTGAVCDQKTSKFFVSHQKESTWKMGEKGIY